VAADRLNTYRSKRDFSKTSEPEGGKTSREGDPIFVVQKHAARSLHYDFRLEVDGALASWAVPKGPSYDPKAKRLAVHVEDHPLDYQDFEGKIPGGEYGGGAVIVWDSGTYRNLTEDRGKATAMRKAIERGHFSVWLDGTKLNGGWAFTRASKPDDRQDGWIMVKRKDEFANPGLDIAKTRPESTKTGRKIEELKDDDGPTWTRRRATYVPPMLAELAKSPPTAGDFVYERKLDGLRAIAVRNGTDVELWSRGHQPFNRRFAKIVEALAALPVDNFTLDGEIVAYDGEQTSFALLQAPGSTAEPVYEIFDVLHLLGNDTRQLPLADRHRLVSELVRSDDRLRPVETLSGDPGRLLQKACRQGWEGLIAKRADSHYRSGRSPDWRKLKCSASQELVIGGYTEPQGKRSQLGALLVGYFEDGTLRYAGKVGTGFSEATLADLGSKLARRSVQESPFVDAPRVKGAHWAKPDLVANIAFTEWTAAGKLRHPRFEGLRSDKKATDVRRERPSAP
jgi:bifunctional non-homologous end joining protein LigD